MTNKPNYFKDCQTIEQIKKTYRELAKKYHPDYNKDIDTNSIMAKINLQYESYSNMTFTSVNHETGKEYTSNFNPDDGYRELIDALLKIPGITIELCGTWLWITGVKKEDKEKQAILKELKFTYSSKKIAWYWKPGTYRKKSKKELTIDEIRNLYGSQTYNSNNKQQQEQKTAIA